jgi:hypothetical protein
MEASEPLGACRLVTFRRSDEVLALERPLRLVLDLEHVDAHAIDGLQRVLVRAAPDQLLLLGSGAPPDWARELLEAGAHWLGQPEALEAETLSELLDPVGVPAQGLAGGPARGPVPLARTEISTPPHAPLLPCEWHELGQAVARTRRAFSAHQARVVEGGAKGRPGTPDPSALDELQRSLARLERLVGAVWLARRPRPTGLDASPLPLAPLLRERLERIAQTRSGRGRLLFRGDDSVVVTADAFELACALDTYLLALWSCTDETAALRAEVSALDGRAALTLALEPFPAARWTDAREDLSGLQEEVGPFELGLARACLAAAGAAVALELEPATQDASGERLCAHLRFPAPLELRA